MGKQRGKIGKYSKISLQKKFQLLKLTQWGTINLKETSEHLRINYSTAKTIFFQFQNKKIREKLTFFENQLPNYQLTDQSGPIRKIAAYKMNSFSSKQCKKIKVICTENRIKSDKQGCEANQAHSFRNESQIDQNEQKMIGSYAKKCKTVEINAQNIDEKTKSSKNKGVTNQNQIPQILNSQPIQGQIEITSQWENISYQNTIMNLGRLAYYYDITGSPFSFSLSFPLSVPQ